MHHQRFRSSTTTTTAAATEQLTGQAPTEANSFACSEIGTEFYDKPKRLTRNYQAPYIAVTVPFYASAKGLWASGQAPTELLSLCRSMVPRKEYGLYIISLGLAVPSLSSRISMRNGDSKAGVEVTV